MLQVTMRRKYNSVAVGVNGWIDLEPNDDLRLEIYYKSNGLIDFEIQFLNGIRGGARKYRYKLYDLTP